MTANLSTRRIDDYGPVEPWRRMKITDADVKDRIAKLVTAGVLAADFTPRPDRRRGVRLAQADP